MCKIRERTGFFLSFFVTSEKYLAIYLQISRGVDASIVQAFLRFDKIFGENKFQLGEGQIMVWERQLSPYHIANYAPVRKIYPCWDTESIAPPNLPALNSQVFLEYSIISRIVKSFANERI